VIAAIYARKSTDQSGVDEQKSVDRQIEHATASSARRKGWTVDEAFARFWANGLKQEDVRAVGYDQP
jgi:hypothetical protein